MRGRFVPLEISSPHFAMRRALAASASRVVASATPRGDSTRVAALSRPPVAPPAPRARAPAGALGAPGALLPRARTFRVSAAPLAPRASAAASPRRGAAAARPASSLDAFVRASCADIGRGGDRETAAAVVDALRGAGRKRVKDLADFSEGDAMALGVPLRLAVAMRRRIEGAAVEERRPTFAAPPPEARDRAQAQREEKAEAAASEDPPSLVSDDEASSSASSSASASASSSASDSDSSALFALRRKLRGVMPRKFRGHSPPRPADARVTRRPSRASVGGDYRLRLDECPDALLDEFSRFRRFLTARRLGSSEAPIRDVTAKKYEDHIRGLLGWMRVAIPREFGDRVEAADDAREGARGAMTTPDDRDDRNASKKIASQFQSMRAAFPDASRASASLAFEHVQWLAEHRKCGANYELVAIRACIAAAKFLHGDADASSDDRGDRPYANVPLVRQLRAIQKDATRRAQKASPASDTRAKWLDWGRYVELCRSLEDECAPRAFDGRARSERAVAWSLQRFLIFGVLSCVPDRQRTIRELRVGKTLFKEPVAGAAGTAPAANGSSAGDHRGREARMLEDASGEANAERESFPLESAGFESSGSVRRDARSETRWTDLRTNATFGDYDYRWVIRHGAGDYKTGKDYGDRPPLVISPTLYGALEEWLSVRRAHLRPAHDFLFTGKNGAPLTDAGVHKLMTSTAYRLTGKRTNPHLVRDMIITHLRGTDASERELEALAVYMGHSVAMQKGTYDRRTKEEKVAPAVELLAGVNLRVSAKSERLQHL